MMAALLVFLGGGLGSLARWLVGLGAVRVLGAGFPFGTLLVNLAGCLVMGVLARIITLAYSGDQALRLLFMTGFLGGFTTFSAFALDAALLWQRDAFGISVLYVMLSVLGSLLAVLIGLWLGGWLLARM
jgi:fluoride exporter